jgi:hypothetical protein
MLVLAIAVVYMHDITPSTLVILKNYDTDSTDPLEFLIIACIWYSVYIHMMMA